MHQYISRFLSENSDVWVPFSDSGKVWEVHENLLSADDLLITTIISTLA